MNISVVIPTYNRENHIEKCIQSILSQTALPTEIIVVDDCSSDATVEKVKNISSELLKIIVLDKNSGAQVARNRGILEAKGEWIAFCDSDDWWLPDKLERQVARIKESGRLLCAGGAKVLKNGELEERWLEGNSGMVFEEVVSNKTYILFQALLVKKECLMHVGMLDENVRAYQEWETALRLTKEYEVEYIKEPLFVYNIHSDETISKDKKRATEGKCYIFHKHKKMISNTLKHRGMVYWYNMLASAYSLNDLRHWKYRGCAIANILLDKLKM